ncbi:signal peptidase II [Sphingomonas histidinilytica]|jgi:signal peptidase II|uniref:Lipoprotein signal peptidase n=1 Tax=Rhizorhabdus histidinilytica TaxID=439228 RepID=A0A1T5AUQ6_9SPHN|nr:signal peptidase II [Rhizorhabdus histidinilytica]MBO9378186.1 signal peptidase II [Rhizorhabdus histidinilytica]QEH79602.1 signal peptidase II [Sphingomonas sp. C8-2]SKB38685.1 signal peptidase II Aspartic peptidase. MEROPS family A08 [Rhizorhabdus histidinilytica]
MADARTLHRPLGFGVAAIVLLLDQISKWAIMGPVALRERGLIEITSFFDLRWVENYGVSMGFLVAGSDRERWLLVAGTALIAVGIVVWIWREKAKGDVVALGLVLGGAIGNIADRTRLGYVADFLDPHIGDWHPFLVFNVADAAITIGVLILVLRALLVREPKVPAENVDAV